MPVSYSPCLCCGNEVKTTSECISCGAVSGAEISDDMRKNCDEWTIAQAIHRQPHVRNPKRT